MDGEWLLCLWRNLILTIFASFQQYIVRHSLSVPSRATTETFFLQSYNQFCIRVCTNANSTYSAAAMCWHELDEMGCEFVMPGNYQLNGTL